MPENWGEERAAASSQSFNTGQSTSDSDRRDAEAAASRDAKKTNAEQLATTPTTPETLAVQPTTFETLGSVTQGFAANQATADGPAGGCGEVWNEMIANQEANRREATQGIGHSESDKDETTTDTILSQFNIDPNSRTQATADGPEGGDPDAWNHLQSSDNDNSQSKGDREGSAVSTDAVTVGWHGLGTLLRGLGAGISAGVGAVVIGVVAIVYPSRLAEDADQPPTFMASGEKGPRLDPESDKVVEDAIGETERETVTTIGTPIDVVADGDREQADEDFDEMGLENIREYDTNKGTVRTGTLADGSKVTVRPSADGRPTIEVAEVDENGNTPRGRTREIRYGTND